MFVQVLSKGLKLMEEEMVVEEEEDLKRVRRRLQLWKAEIQRCIPKNCSFEGLYSLLSGLIFYYVCVLVQLNCVRRLLCGLSTFLDFDLSGIPINFSFSDAKRIKNRILERFGMYAGDFSCCLVLASALLALCESL